ncbi:MAG: hypothetical protein ACE5JL_08000 [Dehalococcoidia bacterium]
MERDAEEMLARSGIQRELWNLRRSMDLRYGYQAYELTVPVEPSEMEADSLSNIAKRFHDQHMGVYGYNAPTEAIQLVNLRVTAIGRLGGSYICRRVSPDSRNLGQAAIGERDLFFPETGLTRCPVYNREKLPVNVPISAPAVIQEPNSTTVVYPSQTARATEWGTVTLSTKGKGDG